MAAPCWQLQKMEQRCGYLLDLELWSDCSFIVGSEPNMMKVKAHKLILTMSSAVFHKMFYEEKSENNEWSIPDVQPETFKALLKYIYTGHIDIDSFDMAWKLWHGGKKYELPHLVTECNSYICSAVSPTNVCQSYELAHFFDEKTIMDKCIEIISTKTKEVLNDSSFVDIELNTLITVLSLDHLNVDSEVDLIHAVVEYTKAEQKRQGQISPPVDSEPPSEKMSELRLRPPPSEEKVLLDGESSSETGPAAEPDSEPATEVVTSEPTAEEVPERERTAPSGIRAAIEKIRFLTLTPEQFAESNPLSILTADEAFAIIMNISVIDSVSMPTRFSDSRERRHRINVVDGPHVVAATDFTTPDEIVQGLASRDLNTLKAAAVAARDMLANDSTTPLARSQLVDAGVITKLVAALDQLCFDLQLDAACALGYIASGTLDHAFAVVDGGAIPKLIDLLGDGGEVAAQAAGVLGALAESGPVNRDEVINLGALPAMLPYMHPNTPLEHLRTYVWAYSNMCWHYNPIVKFELVSPALPHITELLVLTDQEVLVDACLALSSLTDGPNERIEDIQIIPGLTKRLIDLMGHPEPQVQIRALRAFGNMLTGTEKQVNRCLNADPESSCLDHIINFLKCGETLRVKEAAWAASCILAGTPPQIQKALDKQILEPLIKVLSEGDSECQEEAIWAITNLYRGGTAEQLDLMMSAGFLEPYCVFLSTPDHPAVLIILHGLNDLLKDVNFSTNKRIREKLREIGVPQLLKTLKQHKDEKMAMIALPDFWRAQKDHHLGANLGLGCGQMLQEEMLVRLVDKGAPLIQLSKLLELTNAVRKYDKVHR